ncbi:putative LRR receptor-like serine/threonine-protein kinase [Capsicum chinense]|nr:putative LRR receptor-like serine/threonine-protein kinase [Capsicum chinense]
MPMDVSVVVIYLAIVIGTLLAGTVIAVKFLSSKSKQENHEFVNEISIISGLQHPNLVKLYGCFSERNQLLLVYEYLENNSLAHAFFSSEEHRLKIDWPTWQKICIGIAKGLAFLHEESSLKIVYRDIKATNALLDNKLNPKISDFGLVKLDGEDKTHIGARVIGTMLEHKHFATSGVDYLHKVGRTAKTGQPGLVTSLYRESNCDLVATIRHAEKIEEALVGSIPYNALRSKKIDVACDEEIERLSVDVASNSSGLLPSNLIDIIVNRVTSSIKTHLDTPLDGIMSRITGVNEMQEQDLPTLEDEVKFETGFQIYAKLQSGEIDLSTPPDDLLSRKRKWCEVSDEDYGRSFTLISPTPPNISDHISIKEEFCTAEDVKNS